MLAAAIPILFLHVRYQPGLDVSLGSTTVSAYLSDFAVLAVVAVAVLEGVRRGWAPLAAGRPLWIAGALFPSVRLVTIELDDTRSSAAGRLFASVPSVTVLSGHWRSLKGYAPFAMLFADGGNVKATHPTELIDMVQPGGLIVMDDLTPLAQWPREWWGKPDPTKAASGCDLKILRGWID